MRVHTLFFALAWLMTEFITLLLRPLSDYLGYQILLNADFLDFFTHAYNSALWRTTHFDDTVVAGNMFIALIFAMAGCATVYVLIYKYRTILYSRFTETKFGEKILSSIFAEWFKERTEPIERVNLLSKKRLITIVSVFVLILFMWSFVVPYYLKNQINARLSMQWGAPVNISDISISLFPIKIHVQNISIADLYDNRFNRVEASDITIIFNALDLIAERLVIEELTLKGLYFDRKRTVPYQQKSTSLSLSGKKKKGENDLNILLTKEPDFEKLLSHHPLLMTQEIEMLEERLEGEEKEISVRENIVNALLNVEYYRKQIEVLRGNGLRNVQDFNELRKELFKIRNHINNDQRIVIKATDWVNRQITSIKDDLTALDRTVDGDANALLKLYEYDKGRLQNIAKLLYEDEMFNYFHQAQEWIEDVTITISKWKEEKEHTGYKYQGRKILFQEDDPQPAFNIKHLIVDTQVGDKKWVVKGEDLHFEKFLNKKAILTITEKNITSPIRIIGSVNYNQSGAISFEWDLEERMVPVNQRTLLNAVHFPIIIGSAIESIKGTLFISHDRILNGRLQLDYRDVVWDTRKYRQLPKSVQVVKALNEIKDYSAIITISGSIEEPSIEFSSSINKGLSIAMDEALDEVQKEYKEKIEKYLQKEKENQLPSVINILTLLNMSKQAWVQKNNSLEIIVKENLEPMFNELEAFRKNFETKHLKKLKNIIRFEKK